MYQSFKLAKDITGLEYDRFLRAALGRFPFFMLVWRDQFTFRPSARAIRRHLGPFEVRQRRSNRWPGNVMFGHKADIIFYRSDPESFQVLAGPGSLLSWLQPYFPEDLAFFGADRRCLVVSVTHEKDVWILDREFARSLPKRIVLRPDTINEEDWKEFFDYVF
jgi:hypothetical protein